MSSPTEQHESPRLETGDSSDTCDTKCGSYCRSWKALALLICLLTVLVVWQREAWVTLFTEGKFESLPVRSHPIGTPTGDVRDGFNPRVVIPRPFPPITEFPIAKAKDILGGQAKFAIRDNELVLGVSVNGESRAYPINMLTGPQREIINDNLGGLPIAATW